MPAKVGAGGTASIPPCRHKPLPLLVLGSLLAMGAMGSSTLHARLDDVQLKMSASLSAPLRWDNVEGDRLYWMGGEPPRGHGDASWHAVRLEPGQRTVVRVPGGERLRVIRLDAPLTATDLIARLSNASGAAVRQTLLPGLDGRSLLVEAYPSRSGLVSLERPGDAREAIEVAIFVSRRVAPPPIAPYRESMPLGAPTARLRRDAEGGGQTWWRTEANQELSIELSGPARFVLQSRLRYPRGEPAPLQHGWIHMRSEDEPPIDSIDLHFTTTMDSSAVFIDGRAQVVARQEDSYFNVPSGRHRYRLRSDSPLWLRLLQQDDPDYLLATFNEPELPAREVRDEEPAPLLKLSIWGQSGAQTVAALGASAPETERAGQRLAQDNRRRDGPLLAVGAMQAAARRWPEQPVVQGEADKSADAYLQWRELLPEHIPAQPAPHFAWYLTRRLLAPGEDGRGVVQAAQHERDLQSRMESGMFIPLQGRDEHVLRYRLPERPAPSVLRIAIEGGEPGETIHLQFDDQPPVEVALQTTPEVDAERMAPAAGEIALLLQRWLYGAQGGTTLAAAFSRSQIPAPLIVAASGDIPLPRQVGMVRAWRASSAPSLPPVRLAMKLRVSKPYALSVSTLHESWAAIKPPLAGPAALIAALAPEAPATADGPRRDVDSHLQPLARLILTEFNRLRATTAAPRELKPGTGAASGLAQAREMESAGRWQHALEAWGQAAANANAAERVDIRWGRSRALFALGEFFLAEQQLKEALLHGETTAIRRRAAAELTDVYARNADQEALTALACVAFKLDPDQETLSALAIALQAGGLPELALSAGALLAPLPITNEVATAMLKAALQTDAWPLFERILVTLPDAERRFWRGLGHAMRGQWEPAQAALQEAGSAGFAPAADYLAHLRRGLELDRRLRLQDTPPPELLAEWAQWQAVAPGGRDWRDLPPMLRGFAGTASVYAIDRDLSATFYRADPARPVRLGLYGPATLRLEARPLHRTDRVELLEGWLRVRETTPAAPRQLRLFPITQNPPASSLQIVGNATQVAGRAVAAEIQLGSGWHELEVEAGPLPVLLRPQVALPDLRFPVLPLLTAETARRPLAVAFPEAATELFGCRDCITFLPDDANSPNDRAAPVARLRGDGWPWLPPVAAVVPNPVASASGVPASDAFAAALAGADPTAALDLPPPAASEALVAYLSGLLWLAETYPHRYGEILARASHVADANRGIAELQPIMDRLSRNSGWMPLNNVRQSAGLRTREVLGYEPEAPAMKIRQALLPPLQTDEILLSAGNRLVLSLFNPKPARLIAHLAAEDVSGLPPIPLPVSVQVGTAPPRRIMIAPDALGIQEQIALPRGEQTVRFWIDTPIGGQFLRLRLEEPGHGGSSVLEASERFYHVATAGEPLRARIPGPVWLRIDEWRDGGTETRYQLLADAWNELELRPSAQRPEALYRLFFKSVQPEQPITPPRLLEIPTSAVPPAPTYVAERPAVAAYALHDGLTLGGQEDGTGSFGVSWQQRDFSRGDHGTGTRPTGVERYLELGASWRHLDVEQQSWWRADILARRRQSGGPTLGLAASWLYAPNWSSWNLDLTGSLYLQQPGGVDGGSTAHAATFSGTLQQRVDLSPKTYHLPEISAFVKHNSLRPGDMPLAYTEGRIDQDVYTPYAAGHRAGLSFGDSLIHRPWLDTQWHAGARLTTNRDLNPLRSDHWIASIGWKQLFGGAWLDLRALRTHYFADSDRRAASTTRQIALDLGGELWRGGLDRLELNFTWRHDMSNGDKRFGLALVWHDGNGRGYTDFRPGEIDFRDIRTRRQPADDNNRIDELPSVTPWAP